MSHPHRFKTFSKWLIIVFFCLTLISWGFPMLMGTPKIDLFAFIVFILLPGAVGAFVISHFEHQRNMARHRKDGHHPSHP